MPSRLLPPQDLADALQHLVALAMPVRIVDLLEIVNVQR